MKLGIQGQVQCKSLSLVNVESGENVNKQTTAVTHSYGRGAHTHSHPERRMERWWGRTKGKSRRKTKDEGNVLEPSHRHAARKHQIPSANKQVHCEGGLFHLSTLPLIPITHPIIPLSPLLYMHKKITLLCFLSLYSCVKILQCEYSEG